MYYFIVLVGLVSIVGLVFTIALIIFAAANGNYLIIPGLSVISILLYCLIYLGNTTFNEGDWITQNREVPIKHIERVDGTTYVYSKFAVVKDTSAKIYMCETNKLSLIETYMITEKTKKEHPHSRVSLKIIE